MVDKNNIQEEIAELSEAAQKLDFVSVSELIETLFLVDVELGTNTDVLIRESVSKMLNEVKMLLLYEVGEREKMI